MSLKRWQLKYWRDIFGRKELEHDLDAEIRSHVELDVQARIEAGQSPDHARQAALREIRSMTAVQEATRDSWTWASAERWIRDLRYGLRTLRHSPVFAAVVVLSLAIGIAANTAFFSLVDAMLLRKMPLDGVDELVFLDWTSGPNSLAAGLTGTYSKDPATGQQVRTSFAYPTYKAFRDQTRTLSDVFAFFPLNAVTVNVEGRGDSIPGQLVSGNYFSALKVPVAIGRPLTDEDDRSANPVAVISHRYWQRQFNLDRGVLGKTITMNGAFLTIIGVSSPAFTGTQGFGNPVDIWLPLSLEPRLMQSMSIMGEPWMWWLRIMGRTRTDVSYLQVQAELEPLLHTTGLEAFNERPPSERRNSSGSPDMPKLRVQSGSRGLTDNLRNMGPNGWRASQFLAPLAAISVALLLVVWVNVANLMLARASARQREIGVRLALGAGRTRVVRQLLTETMILALAGGMAGGLAAYWLKDLLAGFVPLAGISPSDLRIDPRVLAFTAVMSLLSGIFFGLVPALRATDQQISPALRNSGRSFSAVRTRLSKTLLVAQVAMSVVLLVGAGLFVRTLRNLQNVDVGFDADHLLLFRINPGALTYDDSHIAALYQQLLERLSGLPGVVNASYSDYPLVINSGNDMRIAFGNDDPARTATPVARLRVHWNFFDTMGVPVLSGRKFTAGDNAAVPRVALVNEAFVRKFFPRNNAVGEHFSAFVPLGPTRASTVDVEIVGVVKDVSIRVVREDVPPAVYLPDLQLIPPYASFVVRTAGDPLQLAAAVREAVKEVDAGLPLRTVRTQSEQIRAGFAAERVFAIAATSFSSIAMGLACIGLFGLMCYSVERRTNEIGLRMALGARRADVVRMVMRQTLTLVFSGILIGAAAAIAMAPAVAAMLFNVTPTDPVTMVTAIAVMLGVAGFAAYLPARRAASVDPTIALRCD